MGRKIKGDHEVEFEFSRITKYIYLGTNLCCLMKSHIQTLLQENIHIEIDMEKERQLSPPKIDVYLWLPVADRESPSIEQIRIGVALIDKAVKIKKKIFVHCKYGHGRSPTLVAAYFVSQGMSVSEAIEKVRLKRPEIHLEKSQVEILRKYSRS